jgi:hypothetical protein
MNYKIPVHSSDIADLYDTISKVMLSLGEQMKTDTKEINVYRLDTLQSLYHKVHKRTTGLQIGKPVTFTFTLKEMVTLRYCLLQRRITPGMNELFTIIDKKIHPDMFKRD